MNDQCLEKIELDQLLERVRQLKELGYRLVQIGATRLPDELQLTYSFDLDRRLTNLRLRLPNSDARVRSISSIYWCAFLYENEIHDLFGLQIDDLAVDFHGKLYETAIQFPFGPGKPAATGAPPATAGAANHPLPVGRAAVVEPGPQSTPVI